MHYEDKVVYVTKHFKDNEFGSEVRRKGLNKLKSIVRIEDQPEVMTELQAKDVVGVIADSVRFEESFYKSAKDLRIVARWGVGYDQVNVEAATRHGVLITLTPVHLDTVAEYTIMQWLATAKRVFTLNKYAHDSDARIIRNYDIQGSTLGLYGFGRTGQEVAKRAVPMVGEKGKVLVFDVRSDIQELANSYGARAVSSPDVLFREADAVALHVSGDDTIVGYKQLCNMRSHASLINPSRGKLVNDKDVKLALEEGRLFYYVVDDPLVESRFIHKGNERIISTNHVAGITQESVVRLDAKTFQQIHDALQGVKPEHVLNPEVLRHPRVRKWLRG